jgi:hypothetical protein
VSERDREGEWWANSANKDVKSSSKDTNREKDKEKDTDKDKEREKEKEKEKDKDYFSIESIHDRLRVYAREGGVPLELVDRYSEHRKMKMTPFQEFQADKIIEWEECRVDEKEKLRGEKKRKGEERREEKGWEELSWRELWRGEKKMEKDEGEQEEEQDEEEEEEDVETRKEDYFTAERSRKWRLKGIGWGILCVVYWLCSVTVM